MTDEPTIDEIPADDERPLTRRDLSVLEQQLKGRLGSMATREDLSALRSDLAAQIQQMRTQLIAEIERVGKETRNHFDVVVEKIEDDLKGANTDEISLLKDHQSAHEQRIAVLESKTAL